MSDKYLAHYGVKGQEWYVRHHQSYETAPTHSGKVGTELLDLYKDGKAYVKGMLGRRVQKPFARAAVGKKAALLYKYNSDSTPGIYNADGEKIGWAWHDDYSDGATLLHHISIGDQYQRKGYGRDAVNALFKDLKDRGTKTIYIDDMYNYDRSPAMKKILKDYDVKKVRTYDYGDVADMYKLVSKKKHSS